MGELDVEAALRSRDSAGWWGKPAATIALVYPTPVLVFLFLVAHVHFKFLAHLGAPPFVVLKLPTIRKGPAPQVKVTKEHSAQVRKVADAGAGAAEPGLCFT